MIPARGPAEHGWRLVDQSVETPVGCWRIVLAFPDGPLARRVEAVWTSEGQGCFAEEEILPRTRTEVLFCLGDRHWLRDRGDAARDRVFSTSFVSGLQRSPLHVASPPDSAMAGVRLRPEGVAAFLRDTPSAIAGAVVELDSILGPEVENLRAQIVTSRDLRRRTLLLAAAVARHLEPSAALSPAVDFVLEALLASRGGAPIRDLVRASGYSHRWVTERFRSEVGLAPKAFARVARFESAFERLNQLTTVRWAEFALDFGYADQAHLVHDFNELAGASPTEVFRRRAPDGLGLLNEHDAATMLAAAAPDGAQARS